MNKISAQDWKFGEYKPNVNIQDNKSYEAAEWERHHEEIVSRDVTRGTKSMSTDVLMSMRLTYAASILDKLIDIDIQKAGGVPVVSGTRFKVSQLLAELAEGHSLSYISRQFDLEKAKLSEILNGISICMDRSFLR